MAMPVNRMDMIKEQFFIVQILSLVKWFDIDNGESNG